MSKKPYSILDANNHCPLKRRRRKLQYIEMGLQKKPFWGVSQGQKKTCLFFSVPGCFLFVFSSFVFFFFIYTRIQCGFCCTGPPTKKKVTAVSGTSRAPCSDVAGLRCPPPPPAPVRAGVADTANQQSFMQGGSRGTLLLRQLRRTKGARMCIPGI